MRKGFTINTSATESANEIRAWAIQHDSHGLSWGTLVFLPAGEEPETDAYWVRMPWLNYKKQTS